MLSFSVILLHIVCIHGILLDGIYIPKPLTVRTGVGEIYGKVKIVTFDGQHYQLQEFLGIPYAEPPVGVNRLRKPIPKSPFTSPFSANNYGASCLQQPSGPLENLTMSEDCLFLNVFVPVTSAVGRHGLPVMIWIHGGGFVSGSSTFYPGDVLSSFGHVIVVTLNYRLAHLGFLWTNEGIGNFGLWDQHLAIKWVHDNIAAFGGDGNKVTIFGESAGSTSVVYQTLYQGNRNLFQRAMAQSGGITSSWGFAPFQSAIATFANFTGEIGCSGNHTEIMTCFRNKTTAEVESVMKSTTLNYTLLLPNMDNDFVPQHPRFMLSSKTGHSASLDFFYSLDFLMGSTSIDGTLYLHQFANDVNISDPENLTVPRSVYEHYFIPVTISSIFSDLKTIPQLMKNAAVFEYTDWACPNDDMARNLMLVKLMNDASLYAPSVATVDLHSGGLGGRTYLYVFSTKPTTHVLPVPSWLDGPTQANHFDDVPYVFGFSEEMVKWFQTAGLKYDYNARDISISKGVMTMWTNFAKSG